MKTSGRSTRRTIVSGVTLACAAVWGGAAGCCGADPQCEPALSEEPVPIESARLPAAWTQADAGTVRVVVTDGPYRLSDFALEQLAGAMSDQAGLAVDVLPGLDTGLPASGVLDSQDVVKAGRAQIPPDTDPALVIVAVEDTTFPDATFGFTDFELKPRPIAVMGLHMGPIRATAIGPVSPEMIEATVAVHEAGHWLGVPARAFHTSAIDGVHCTNARCVMFKGSRAGLCAVLANVCTGIPVRFCPDCADELAEMRRRRDGAPRAAGP